MADWTSVGGTPVRAPSLDWSSVGGSLVKRATALAYGKYGAGIKSEILKDLPGSSGFGGERTAARNRAVGGVPNSSHLTGNAYDFQPPKGMTRKQALAILKKDPLLANYQILDEGPGSAHSSGPHLHVGATDKSKVIDSNPDDWSSVGGQPVKGTKSDDWSSVGGKPVKGTIDWNKVPVVSGQPNSSTPSPAAGKGPQRQSKAQPEGAIDKVRNFGLGVDQFYDKLWEGAKKLPGQAIHGVVSTLGEGIHDITHLGETYQRLDAFNKKLDDMSPEQKRALVVKTIDQYKEKYGSVQGFEKAWSTNPGGVVMDVAGSLNVGGRILGTLKAARKESSLLKGMSASEKDLYLSDKKMAAQAQGALNHRATASKLSAIGNVFRHPRIALNPSRASDAAKSTALFIRKSSGVRGSEADRINYQMSKLAKRIDRGTDEENGKFITFLETRSKAGNKSGVGSYLGGDHSVPREEMDYAHSLNMNKEDVKAANTIRDSYQHWWDAAAKAVGNNTGRKIGFVKDYYTHMWDDSPEEVERKLNRFYSTKQGTSRYFKQRTIPTIADGLAAGLKPKYGIVQTVQIYSENMANLVTTHESQAFIKDNGYGGFFRPGQQPEGWVRANGILNERRPVRGKGGRPKGAITEERLSLRAPDEQKLLENKQRPISYDEETKRLPFSQVRLGQSEAPLQIEGAGLKSANPPPEGELPGKPADRAVSKEVFYMKPEVARIYNNFISKPFDPSASPGQAVGHYAYKSAVNAMLWKFALSAYHASTMAFESQVSDISRGFEDISRGKFLKGAGRVGRGYVPGASVLSLGVKGHNIRNAILFPEKANPFTGKLSQKFSEAGGRLTMNRDYRGTSAKTFWDSFKDGTFKKEFEAQASNIVSKDATKLERIKASGTVISNALHTLSAPLFEEAIPRIKMGAWSDMMQGYMEANPEATEAEIQAKAAQYLDSVDNRFGEMSRNNMFWSRQAQQVANSLMLSPTWVIGSGREIGGGIADIPASIKGIKSGKGISQRTAYIMAMGALVPVLNGVFTYLKTRTMPKGEDFLAYRTGGQDPRTKGPERGLFPGNQKEIFGIANAVQNLDNGGPLQYVQGKGNPVLTMGRDVITGKDYKGSAIYGQQAAPGAAEEWLRSNANPIMLERQQQKLKGSHIGLVETILGSNTAPLYMEEGFEQPNWMKKKNIKQKRINIRAEKRRENRYQQ